MANTEFETFIRERNEALLSLDLEKIKSYFRKYDIDMPTDDLVLWASIHKARTAETSFSAQERRKSREWLSAHGFTHMGDT